MVLHSEMSMMGDEATTYIAPNAVHSPTRPVASEYDAATISTLLGPFEKINQPEDQYSEATTYVRTAADFGESPRKISRVGTADVSVDKLFSSEDTPQPMKDGFQFRKFGMEINLGQRSPPETANQNSMYTDLNRMQQESQPTHEGVVSPSHSRHAFHNLTSPTTLTTGMEGPVKETPPYHENVEQISPTSHYSVPHSLRNNRRNLLHNTPPLTQSFPDRHDNMMLKILKQPEAQHRARYMTEGSRGAVKDSQQQGHPIVQLLGYDGDARLEIFIGADSGKVKPHGFYQACRINGKNASVSREREVDGTVVIEMEFDKSKHMTATIDCIGILKLRNTDVEKRVGLLKTKKKSTKCRLIYRVNIPQNDGSLITLQTASTVIACTQPAGQPEICRMSLHISPLVGGQSLFVIGKNFVKGFRVKFQELEKGSDEILWEQEADIDHEFTHSTHFICTIPAYKNDYCYGVINAQVVVEACGGTSEPVQFQYSDHNKEHVVISPSCSTSSNVTPCSPVLTTPNSNSPAAVTSVTSNMSNTESPRNIVSPEALELVAQLQQQQSTQNSSKMFRIPEGVDFISQDSNHSQRNQNYISEPKPGLSSQLSGTLLNYSNSNSSNSASSGSGGSNSHYMCHQ